jgi:SAM-dependent methyltransferase
MGLERLLQLEEGNHFWIQGKQLAVREMVGRHCSGSVLDIGCGTGALLKKLSEAGIEISGIDIHPGAVARCKKQLPKALIIRGDAIRLPLRDSSFEMILALDIMEHVDRDDLLLAEAFRALKPGGHLIMCVPAWRWLFAERDRAAGHLRRYHRRDVVSLLNRAGFLLESLNYYNFILFPLILLSRLLRLREGTLPPLLNSLLASIVKQEVKLSRKWFLPWGSSLMVRGIKPDV